MQCLFYKVIHNKYLFNLIMNQIESVEWIQYTDYKQIYRNNRIKFKDIKSLEWMIKNNQYELLKCKLQVNEYIEIDQIGLECCLKLENEILLKEIITLLLDKKRKELKEFDLISISLNYKDGPLFKSFKVLSKHPFSLPINIDNISNGEIKSIPIIYKLLKVVPPLSFIPNYNDDGFIINELNFICSKFSYKKLNSFLSRVNNQINQEIRIKFKKFKITFNHNNKKSNESINKFIGIYTGQNCFENDSCDIEIKTLIFLSSNSQQYQDSINCILSINGENRFKNSFPKFNSILNELNFKDFKSTKLKIKNINSIDWLYDNSNHPIIKKLFIDYKSKELFQFNNTSLINYAISKFKDNESIINFKTDDINNLQFKTSLYKYPFFKSITKCMIMELEYINKNIENLLIDSNSFYSYFKKDSNCFSKLSTDKLIELINFLNLNEYYNFIPYFFPQFIRLITMSNCDNDHHSIIDYSRIKINFNLFKSEYEWLFIDVIKEFLPNILVLLFNGNNINPIHTKYTLIIQYITLSSFPKNTKPSFNSKYNSIYYVDRIIKCIELIVYQISNDIFIINPNDSNEDEFQEYIYCCNLIVNYLFKSLIGIPVLTIDKFKSIYHVIVNGVIKTSIGDIPIIIEHTLYNSIFYLSIYSKKFAKFIWELPNDVRTLNYPYPKIFTYDFIFNNSFDTILGKLIKCKSDVLQLDNSSGIVNEDNDNSIIVDQFDLDYLLDIRRVDLYTKYSLHNNK